MSSPRVRRGIVLTALLAAFASLSVGVGSAAAAKQAIALFPSDVGSVAVNSSGAGVADAGDVYITGVNRIQRFAHDDNGTPSNPYDDSYPLVSVWGADVDASTEGGSDYEICTPPTPCKVGVASGGNGTPAGNGTLSLPIFTPKGIAVDQDTGFVYVADNGNRRVNVYAGDGTFQRSFGWDVVASGPGNTGTGYEVCVGAAGDVCKAGVSGSGPGQITQGRGIAVSQPDGNPATGTVLLGDSGNNRIAIFGLDGSSPSSLGASAQFGTGGPRSVAVDSRGVIYAEALNGEGAASSQVIARYDSQNANGVGVGFLAPIGIPPLLSRPGSQVLGGLQVSPDPDGPGPETDVLYALRVMAGPVPKGPEPNSVIQQFGPLNPPGLTTPPAAADDEHGENVGFGFVGDGTLGLDAASGQLFVPTEFEPKLGEGLGTYVLDEAGGPPSGSLDSIDEITSTSATANITVEPNGPPPVSYRLEYSTDGVNWSKEAQVLVGTQETPQSIDAPLDPLGGGLEPNTLYHVRLLVTKAFTPPVITAAKTFTTLAEAPHAETTGSPVRSATSARLEGRVNPRGSATTYHFEYGTDGPCSANPCQATEPLSGGAGGLLTLVSQRVEGLEPDTTYHYRLVAENGSPGSPDFGQDMTVRTRASDTALDHGDFPGPPGSDRAYEQVNVPNTGGNPVSGAVAFSSDGERASYHIVGGSPLADTGSALNQFYAERTPSGWRNRAVLPPRSELIGPIWNPVAGESDLSSMLAVNSAASGDQLTFWRLVSGSSPTRLFDYAFPPDFVLFYTASANSTRVVAKLKGGALDPAFPTASTQANLYDISSSSPQLVSILPGGDPPACGVLDGGLPLNWASEAPRWVSADGGLAFFPSKGDACGSNAQLYVRDIPASSTELISGPPLSGPSCEARFLKSTDGAAFFFTQSRLADEDIAPPECTKGTPNGDVYRYDLADDTLECVTCVVSGLTADVNASLADGRGSLQEIAVASDGSRVYFRSLRKLVAGAPAGGTYRVMTESGDLRFVGAGVGTGEYSESGNALSADGSVLIFRSSHPSLNPLGEGTDNGGKLQYYRYDDDNRSLTCISCPADGEPAPAAVSGQLLQLAVLANDQVGPNLTPLSADGDTFAFTTPSALVNADQNTPAAAVEPALGTDVYEWRDGRLLLVSDGLTEWPHRNSIPAVQGVSASGRDIFFTEAAQLTPDALDGYLRLYDARIGGGFEFPVPPPPCPLEVCQGTPKGAPGEAPPGSANLTGQGNSPRPDAKPRKRCAKPKRRVRRGGKVRCVSAKRAQRAKRANRSNANRRNPR